jgi:hypothetical protein
MGGIRNNGIVDFQIWERIKNDKRDDAVVCIFVGQPQTKKEAEQRLF